MKVLQVHNEYLAIGGEDIVVNEEYRLLKSRGHEVHQLIKRNHDMSIFDKLRLVFTTHMNRSAMREFRSVLLEIKPDVVHVHNFFPRFSPGIFDVCQELEIPVCLTLHNYRIVYPNGSVLNKGRIDYKNLGLSAFKTIKDKVYRNSFLQTAVVAFMIEYHKKRNTWNDKVNKLICLTEFSKSIFIEAGIKPDNIKVKPNFLADSTIDSTNSMNIDQYIYVGRLSPEKGIDRLVGAWIKEGINKNLIIVGDGILKPQVESMCQESKFLEFRGFMDNDQVNELLSSCKALIFPSIWFEGFPITILEAMRLGKPVIASNLGSQSTIVEHLSTGIHFDPYNSQSLVKAIGLLEDNKLYRKLQKAAQATFEDKFTSDVNYKMLMDIYEEMVSDSLSLQN